MTNTMKKKVVSLFLLIFGLFSGASYGILTRYSFPDPPFLYACSVKPYQVVDTIIPASIARGQTVGFTVWGRDFQAATTIEVVPRDGLTLSNYQVNSAEKLSFVLTASTDASTGGRNLIVYNPTGSYEVYNAIYVMEYSATSPTINSLNPPSGEAGQTLTLTIEGTNFDLGASLEIGGNSSVAINSYNVISSTKIVASITISSSAAGGSVPVVVRNPDGGIGQRYFYIYKGKAGFSITGTWPEMPDNAFPRGSIIAPFIILGTGISSQAAVSFSDPNITYDASKMTIDPNGNWIRIAELTIGENAALGISLITVTNYPETTTATTGIVIKEKKEFLNVITNLAPVYGSNVTGFKLADSGPMTFKFMANKDIAEASTYVTSPAGIPQVTNFINIVKGSSATVQGVRAEDVRVFSVSPSGVGKVELPKVSDLGMNLGPGLYTLNLKVRAADGSEEIAKVKFVIRPQ